MKTRWYLRTVPTTTGAPCGSIPGVEIKGGVTAVGAMVDRAFIVRGRHWGRNYRKGDQHAKHIE